MLGQLEHVWRDFHVRNVVEIILEVADLIRISQRRAPDQGLVAHQPEGKADQDRRESRQPRLPCRLPDGGSSDPKKPLRRPAAQRRTATAASHVNSMRRSVSRVRQNPQEKCVLIAKSSALSTFDLASACLGAVRRRAGGNQADGSGLPGARNGRRLSLNRQQSGGCRLPTAWAAEAQFVPSPKPASATGSECLARRQAEESGELAPAGEHAGVLDRGHDRRGGEPGAARPQEPIDGTLRAFSPSLLENCGDVLHPVGCRLAVASLAAKQVPEQLPT